MVARTHRIPDFIIVGAPKSGTTSLYHYLRQHPNIFMPQKKEPVFFCSYKRNFGGSGTQNFNRNLVIEEDAYLELFRDEPDEALIGEASTDYLLCPSAPQNIKAWISLAKIIIILRNPIDRAYSEHKHLIRDLLETESFQQSLNLEQERMVGGYIPLFWHVQRSLCYESVRSYLTLFRKEQVHIILYEDLSHSINATLANLCGFLNLPKIDLKNIERYNLSGLPKSKTLQTVLIGWTRIPTKITKALIPSSIRGRLRRTLLAMNMEREPMNETIYQYLLE